MMYQVKVWQLFDSHQWLVNVWADSAQDAELKALEAFPSEPDLGAQVVMMGRPTHMGYAKLQ